MPTPPTTIEDYCALLVKSRLLLNEEVDAAYQRFLKESEAEGKSTTDIDRFRRYLVRQRLLTDYQAYMIQRGRAEGFFIGGYKILDRVGKGHMGVGGVYKALHHLGQIVALKILPASKASNPHTLARFQREARLLLQLNHPNIVRAFQVGEAQGVHYLVMEYLEGETLQDVLSRRGRLPWQEAVRLIHQALQGLQHLHERHMVHRDLKPSNLMLVNSPDSDDENEKKRAGTGPETEDTTWNATLKILDIGLGRELFDENTPEGQIETQITQEGSVLGTPDYMAPEQARDASSADIRADIYSLGCVLYHCITGQPPFPDSNIMSQMVRHAMEPARPLREFVPDIPPTLQIVMDTLLAKQPEKRYATPAAADAALQPLLSSRGARPTLARLTPAYKDWLESESGLELAPPLPNVRGTESDQQQRSSITRKTSGDTAPKPILPTASPAAAVLAENTGPKPILPVASPVVAVPAAASAGPVAVSTAPQPVTSAVPSYPLPQAVPAGVHPTLPAASPLIEVDVELVTGPIGPMTPPVTDDRPLTELSRRDWIMLIAGSASVLTATTLGFVIARLLRPKPPEAPSTE
jgi:serine/threonine protein kinase